MHCRSWIVVRKYFNEMSLLQYLLRKCQILLKRQQIVLVPIMYKEMEKYKNINIKIEKNCFLSSKKIVGCWISVISRFSKLTAQNLHALQNSFVTYKLKGEFPRAPKGTACPDFNFLIGFLFETTGIPFVQTESRLFVRSIPSKQYSNSCSFE